MLLIDKINAIKDADVIGGKRRHYSVDADDKAIKIWSYDLNDGISFKRDDKLEVNVRKLGRLIDSTLGLKGQHQSRLWSMVRRVAKIG